MRALHILLYAYGSKDVDIKQAAFSLASAAVGAALLGAAAGFDGVTQDLLWVAALTVDYLGPVSATCPVGGSHPGISPSVTA